MRDEMSLQPKQGRGILYILVWLLVVAAGIALAWYGFSPPRGGEEPVGTPEPVGTFTPLVTEGPGGGLPSPTFPPPPTSTPQPSPTLEPTAVPSSPTPVTPKIVTGVDGANVRTGPGLNYTRIGYIDPGVEAEVTGRYGDWWQIRYQGGAGWVYSEIVTPYNTDGVPEVQPPPAPTPIPVTATPVPPTPTTAPTAVPTPDFRGLVVNNFWIENAPGPFNSASDIWFNIDITNPTNRSVEYAALGAWVEETDQFQTSWTDSSFSAGQHFTWRDHVNQFDLGPGTYNIWLRICFPDGVCVNMWGPIAVTIQ